MTVCRLPVRALSAEGRQRQYQVRQMRLAIDDLKVMIQLAKELKAFQNFRQFQIVSEFGTFKKTGFNFASLPAENGSLLYFKAVLR